MNLMGIDFNLATLTVSSLHSIASFPNSSTHHVYNNYFSHHKYVHIYTVNEGQCPLCVSSNYAHHEHMQHLGLF